MDAHASPSASVPSGSGAPFLPSDLTGFTFGRLKVRRLSARRDAQGNRLWLCDCACGGVKYVSRVHLRRGQVVSCGCAAAEQKSLNFKRHAQTREEVKSLRGELARFKSALAESLDHCESLYERIHDLEADAAQGLTPVERGFDVSVVYD